jgi:hypothetical protein
MPYFLLQLGIMVGCSSTHENSMQDGPPTFLEAHEMPPPTNKSHVKPLDKDSLAPSTSELAPPPLTQSSPTVQELLKQDDKKQFIHFVKMLATEKNEWPVPPAPTVVCNTQNYDEATQGKIVESLNLDSHQDPEIEKVCYADVAAAPRAAAESADCSVLSCNKRNRAWKGELP